VKIAISGTYSAGKTSTVMALSHFTGIPRTLAQTIREIMPDAVPGKSLAEVTPAEYLQLAMRRHTGRVAHEALLGDSFVSDGSSLQEWIYAAGRVRFGMNPSASEAGSAAPPVLSDEMRFFDEVVAQYGHAFRQHVKGTYDFFIHLRNQRPISADGHRPLNEDFRAFCDDQLRRTLADLEIPHYVVGGTIPERLQTIVELCHLPTVMSVEDAVVLAQADYAAIDWTLETNRTVVA
jgi:hypothetical protein